MAEKKEKRYVSDNAQLMAEWDWEKNNKLGLYPDQLTCGSSSKKVWWICAKCGHSWQAKPLSRTYGTGCPICARIKAKQTYKSTRLSSNSLAEVRPDLLDEWDYELNGELTPNQVTASTNQKVWWRCKNCNQPWFAKISGRNYGRGCPVCAGQKLVVGVNDLATINPQLASEWDYDNNELTPQQVSARNNIMAAWICSICGHRWQALVSTRNTGTGCPQCQKSSHSSIPEQIIYFYIKQAFPDTINGYTIKSGNQFKSLDIFIPSINVGIEYDGKQWHQDFAYDIAKNQFLSNQGVDLIRIRENGCPILNDNSYCIMVDYDSSNYNYLNDALIEIFKFLSQKYSRDTAISLNINEDIHTIISEFENDKREHSLLYANPTLAEEWDYEKNNKILPQQVNVKSNKKFWWICKQCGYSWKSNVYDRNKGVGCPRCVGKVVYEGVNDLQSQRPKLLVEWDYEKNNLLPNEISYRSDKKAWWICQQCGYSWTARVADRSNGVGCPACAGKVVMVGKNDLVTINPTLSAEWDYIKNKDLTPQMVSGGSNKKVWWTCKTCSHSWQRDVYSRNTRGSGCPQCAREKRKKSKVK